MTARGTRVLAQVFPQCSIATVPDLTTARDGDNTGGCSTITGAGRQRRDR
jgi:hypothetical protein